MTGAELLAREIGSLGVKDAFGIPGTVVFPIMEKLREQSIDLHLNYNEQASGFAAYGYSVGTGGLGVAYATKGPGVTNLITPIYESFCDSVPVLFITSHNSESLDDFYSRGTINQEIDTVSLVKKCTKFAKRIDSICDLKEAIDEALFLALSGRKGPVFLDISNSVLSSEIDAMPLMEENGDFNSLVYNSREEQRNYELIYELVNDSKRPVFLVGDGIKNVEVKYIEAVRKISSHAGIPILSSRVSQDVFSGFEYYFGYIGSHATRYSNFILEKSDLIISLGNRMAYPTKSLTYSKMMKNKQVIRVDVDEDEFHRLVPNSVCINSDVRAFLDSLDGNSFCRENRFSWIECCEYLQEKLFDLDFWGASKEICKLLDIIPNDSVLVSDVGNNELWFSRAYEYCHCRNRVIFSKNFKTVGSAIGKAVGAYFATKKPVVCFVGDEGIQFNIQELQLIYKEQIPICVVIVNNKSLGMIRDSAKKKGSAVCHSTCENGYSQPDFEAISNGYGIEYCRLEEFINDGCGFEKLPKVVELKVDDENEEAYIPHGNSCVDFFPPLNSDLMKELVER